MDAQLSSDDDDYFPGKISACFADNGGGDAAVTFKDLAEMMEAVVDGFRAAMLKRDAQIAGLKGDIARLQSEIERKLAGKYMGTYKPGAVYSEGSEVTYDGSLFHAHKTTKERPGSGCPDWQLKVKRGRDGKDGKDATNAAR